MKMHIRDVLEATLDVFEQMGQDETWSFLECHEKLITLSFGNKDVKKL